MMTKPVTRADDKRPRAAKPANPLDSVLRGMVRAAEAARAAKAKADAARKARANAVAAATSAKPKRKRAVASFYHLRQMAPAAGDEPDQHEPSFADRVNAAFSKTTAKPLAPAPGSFAAKAKAAMAKLGR